MDSCNKVSGKTMDDYIWRQSYSRSNDEEQNVDGNRHVRNAQSS